VDVAATASIVRSVGKVLAVEVASTPTIARQIAKTIALSVSATISLIATGPSIIPNLIYTYVVGARQTFYVLGQRATSFIMGPRGTNTGVPATRVTSHAVTARQTSYTVPAKVTFMATIPVLTKDPNDIVNYTINWATWLGSDTISTSAWTVPSGITESSSTSTSTTAIIKLSGGTAGEIYTLTNRITTSASETKDQTIKIKVEAQ
jgi:hypothetical protein